jgi:hypothetical protein
MSKRPKPIVVKFTEMQADAVRAILDDLLQPYKPQKDFPFEMAKWRNAAWNAKFKIEEALFGDSN